MCGIVGYVGMQNAAHILLNGLANLEYRGYDSAGISLLHDGGIQTLKKAGRLQNLVDLYNASGRPSGHCGIGHTRWATYGEPTDGNAHPHATEKVAIIHNGIVENYLELKQFLLGKGYTFQSQTDTEILLKTIDYHYKGDPFHAIIDALKMVEGSYALCIVFADDPDTIYGVRQACPLIVGLGEEENFIASDVPAILEHTRDYYLLEEREIAVVKKDLVEVFDLEGHPIRKKRLTADWDIAQARMDGYPHFMLKEIHEQPKVLRDTLHPRIKDGMPDFTVDGLPENFFARYDKLYFIACGTAMYAGTIGKTMIEKLARVSAEVDCASEFRSRDPIFTPNTLVVVVSQSGETADTLAALRHAKSKGVDILAVVNVTGSTIAREADYVLHTYAGPEISVASTKAFSVQVALLCLVALEMARQKGQLTGERTQTLTAKLLEAVERTAQVIETSGALQEIAEEFVDTTSLFYIGRGVDHAMALEGSLKLKEISYIHCEAYAGGEMKHGTISLITDGVPVVALATQKDLLPKIVSNIKEVACRGADVLLITREDFAVEDDLYHHIIRLPVVEDLFEPLLSVVVVQLFAYHVAVARGCDVDKPRNLAKSVTVE